MVVGCADSAGRALALVAELRPEVVFADLRMPGPDGLALAEALTVCKAVGLDMNTTYEAIRISSGNSFVHETESQVILNGSRDISFTMDLVIKDVGLFDQLAQDHNVPLELSPLVLNIFKDSAERYGQREFSPNVIRRYEEPCGVKVLGQGFPAEMTDDEPEEPGYEVIAKR
jgi:3-hydroxyisobutyrate dehydrogenase